MQQLFLPYPLALKAKELGFDEQCFACYQTKPFYPNDPTEPFLQVWLWETDKYCIVEDGNDMIGFKDGTFIKAPLYQQIIDFLREKHGLIVSISPLHEIHPQERFLGYQSSFSGDTVFGEYYEALEAAITEAFKLVNETRA